MEIKATGPLQGRQKTWKVFSVGTVSSVEVMPAVNA